MQRNVVVIGCCATKSTTPGPAREVYISRNFRKDLQLAESCDADVYIFSAVVGLITPDTYIEPYNGVAQLSELVKKGCHRKGVPYPPVVPKEVLLERLHKAGEVLERYDYRVYLLPKLESKELPDGFKPFWGLPFFEQNRLRFNATPETLGLRPRCVSTP